MRLALVSAEYIIDNSLLRLREEVTVASSLFVGTVTNELVDEPLIDSFTCTIADETVTKNVPATNDLPLCAIQHRLQMM